MDYLIGGYIYLLLFEGEIDMLTAQTITSMSKEELERAAVGLDMEKLFEHATAEGMLTAFQQMTQQFYEGRLAGLEMQREIDRLRNLEAENVRLRSTLQRAQLQVVQLQERLDNKTEQLEAVTNPTPHQGC